MSLLGEEIVAPSSATKLNQVELVVNCSSLLIYSCGNSPEPPWAKVSSSWKLLHVSVVPPSAGWIVPNGLVLGMRISALFLQVAPWVPKTKQNLIVVALAWEFYSALTVPLQCPYSALTVPYYKNHSALTFLSYKKDS